MKNLLKRIGFWLLLPLSGVQGLRLRRTAIRLPEAVGACSGVIGNGEPVHLLALGDSIVAGVGTGTRERSLPVQFALALAESRECSVHWYTEGANGANVSDLLHSLGTLHPDQEADVILISIGVNDVTGLSSIRRWRTLFEQLVVALRKTWPSSRVVFAGLPPMGVFPLPPQPLRFTLGQRAATLDAIAAEIISRQPGMLHIPTEINPMEQEFCEDGFHPSAESCAYWALMLAQRFEAANLDMPDSATEAR